jgi:hypothetical protein
MRYFCADLSDLLWSRQAVGPKKLPAWYLLRPYSASSFFDGGGIRQKASSLGAIIFGL